MALCSKPRAQAHLLLVPTCDELQCELARVCGRILLQQVRVAAEQSRQLHEVPVVLREHSGIVRDILLLGLPESLLGVCGLEAAMSRHVTMDEGGQAAAEAGDLLGAVSSSQDL